MKDCEITANPNPLKKKKKKKTCTPKVLNSLTNRTFAPPPLKNHVSVYDNCM